jgi:hypothetical protein
MQGLIDIYEELETMLIFIEEGDTTFEAELISRCGRAEQKTG